MDSFKWSNTFLTGQNGVDEEHFYLVKLINQFGELITKNEASLEVIDGVYQELKSYAIYHFKSEEQLMLDIGIDEGFFLHHQQVHQDFLDKVVLMHSQISKNNRSAGKHLLDFLTNWLIFHILVMDKNMGRQIDKIKLGSSAKEAFYAELEPTDSATGVLLTALNNLFYQVSDRNHELLLLNQSLEKKVEERTKSLQLLNESLEHLSVTDQLTNLPNRRFAISHLTILWNKSDNEQMPLSCLMLDIDNFKGVNDTYGHDVGDEVLVKVTQKLQQTLRNDDVVCRLGGDEFLVICDNTDFSGAKFVAQVLSDAIQELTVKVGDGVWPGSLSIGVATKLSSMSHVDELIKMADQGVYLAKQAGKGCVRSI